MGKGIQSREQFSNPRPPYPLASRRMGEQGAVDLQLCLSQRGDVESVAVIKSSGYRRLDQSALETVKTWKFSALEMVTAPLSDCYRLPIQFRLEA
jgi:protein TonB